MMRISVVLAASMMVMLTSLFLLDSDAQPVVEYDKPDLALVGLEFKDPDHIHMKTGDRTHITICIENTGFVVADGGWELTVFDNERLIYESSISTSLEVGSRIYINFTYKLREGLRTFLAVADSSDQVEEMTEDNNELQVAVEVNEEGSVSDTGDSTPTWRICCFSACGVWLALFFINVIILVIWKAIEARKKGSG